MIVNGKLNPNGEIKELNFDFSRLHETVQTILNKYNNIALGGCSLIRNLLCENDEWDYYDGDYDLFLMKGTSWDTIYDIIKIVGTYDVCIGRGVVNINFNANPFDGEEPPIQLILTNFESPKDIIKTADLSISGAVLCGGKLFMTDIAEHDIKRRIVSFDKFYNMTATRLTKYLNYGFGLDVSGDKIRKINNMEIFYKDDIIDHAVLHEIENIGYNVQSPYNTNSVYMYMIYEPIILPFYMYTSTFPYMPDLDYSNITWREYISSVCHKYDFTLDEVCDTWLKDCALHAGKLLLTREYITDVYNDFYKNLDNKIIFWVDPFINIEITHTIIKND
jgi:hypothetical protein